jgi:hypothetical protein
MSGMKRRNSTFCQSINCAVERQEQPARSRLAASESDRRATPETQCPRQDLGDEVTVEQDILQSAPQVVLPSLAPVAMADPLERGVELSHARPFSVRKTVNGTVPLSKSEPQYKSHRISVGTALSHDPGGCPRQNAVCRKSDGVVTGRLRRLGLRQGNLTGGGSSLVRNEILGHGCANRVGFGGTDSSRN